MKGNENQAKKMKKYQWNRNEKKIIMKDERNNVWK